MQPGLRPAPYLASRGMTWIQRQSDETMDDAALRDYLGESYRLILRKLPKRLQAEVAAAPGRRADLESFRTGKPAIFMPGSCCNHYSGIDVTRSCSRRAIC